MFKAVKKTALNFFILLDDFKNIGLIQMARRSISLTRVFLYGQEPCKLSTERGSFFVAQEQAIRLTHTRSSG